jgi:hypothetical protein
MLVLGGGVFAIPLTQQGNFKVSVVGTATGSVPRDCTKVNLMPNIDIELDPASFILGYDSPCLEYRFGIWF